VEPKKPPQMTDAQIDALLDAMGKDKAEGLLSEALKADAAVPYPQAASAKEIRARVKELAAKNPELIVRIINYWIKEACEKR
jgi:flagellar biosynthesis/type III secretory pathway M-ring protein FliF/YscJ